MAHFHEVCHENCVLRYFARILLLRNLEFRGLEGQFDVKKANFRGLIPKISYLRPILTSRTYPWPIIFVLPWDFCPKVYRRNSSSQKLDFRVLKCQSDVKKVNFRGLIAKIGYSRAILTFRTHLWPIFMDYVIRVCWRYF